MTDPLHSLLPELERFGKANDAATSQRPRRMLNITRDTGELLAVLVRATLAQRLLEIGTSNGYSTLWLASAARAIGGSVVTVELSEHKAALARESFARSGSPPGSRSSRAMPARCWNARPRAPSTSCSWTPSGRSMPAGGRS